MASRRSKVVDEEAKFREKHQVLLQEYLVLQKECVSKKRKLKEAKDRKQTLFDEIRFLKQRRKLLLKMQSQNSEQQDAVLQPQQPDKIYEAGPSGRYAGPSEPVFQNSRATIGSPWASGNVGKEEASFEPLRIGKKTKNLFPNGKRAEKRKITWQDQLALKV